MNCDLRIQMRFGFVRFPPTIVLAGDARCVFAIRHMVQYRSQRDLFPVFWGQTERKAYRLLSVAKNGPQLMLAPQFPLPYNKEPHNDYMFVYVVMVVCVCVCQANPTSKRICLDQAFSPIGAFSHSRMLLLLLLFLKQHEL